MRRRSVYAASSGQGLGYRGRRESDQRATEHERPRPLLMSQPRSDHFVDLVDNLVDALEIVARCHAVELQKEQVIDRERLCKDDLGAPAGSQRSRCLRVLASLGSRGLHPTGFQVLHGGDHARSGRAAAGLTRGERAIFTGFPWVWPAAHTLESIRQLRHAIPPPA